VFPSVFVATLAAVVLAAASFALDAVQLITPVGRVARRLRARALDFAVGIGLHRPSGLARALAGLALATLLIFTQIHANVIVAWASSFNGSPIANLLPIGENQRERIRYNQFLDVVIPLFIYGLYRVVRLRRREGSRDGTAALTVFVGVIAVLVLMREWPYRVFNHRDFERVDLDGSRCYLNGESGAEFLVLCPAAEPPRNHVVRRDDPRLRRVGTSENIFRGITPGSKP